MVLDYAGIPTVERPTYRLGATEWEPPDRQSFSSMPAEMQAMYRASALVEGAITSAPLDLADRMEDLKNRLGNAGWRVLTTQVDTDFGDFVPVPGAKHFKIWLHRKNLDATTAEDPGLAELAVKNALNDMNLDYSALGRWVSEIKHEVVIPTIDTLEHPTEWPVPWWVWPAGGLVAAAVAYPYVAPILNAFRRR